MTEPQAIRDELAERARSVLPWVRERAEETSRLRRVPDETIADLRAAGLFEILKPRAFGGEEIRFDACMEAMLELGRGDGSTAWVCAVINVHDLLVALFPGQAQHDVWDGGKTLVASSFMPGGKATPDGEGFRLSGKWSFSSGVDNSEWAILGTMFGMVGDPPHPDIRFVLVPRSDYEVIDDWHVMGLCGTGSKSLAVQDAFLPAHRILPFASCVSGDTPGSEVHDGPIYRAPIWAVFPFCISSPATGIARGALEAYVERMSERTTVFGNEKISEMRPIHLHFAEAAALSDAAELLYKRSIRETVDKIAEGVPLEMAHRVRSRRDQGYSIVMATRAVEHLFKSMGGRGLYESNPVQRAYRDLHAVAGQIANNWDVTAAMYGQVTLGGPPTDPFF